MGGCSPGSSPWSQGSCQGEEDRREEGEKEKRQSICMQGKRTCRDREREERGGDGRGGEGGVEGWYIKEGSASSNLLIKGNKSSPSNMLCYKQLSYPGVKTLPQVRKKGQSTIWKEKCKRKQGCISFWPSGNRQCDFNCNTKSTNRKGKRSIQLH